MTTLPSQLAPQRILIIRPTALGDVSRTVPALVSLRQAWPDARIDWLVNTAFVEAVAHHPALNEAIPFDRKRFGKAWRNPKIALEFRDFIRQIRSRKYDLVIDLQGLLRSGLITRLTQAPLRFGFANARELGWLGYNQRIHIDENMHTVDRMLAMVEAVGVPAVHDMQLYEGEENRRWLEKYLDSLPGTDHRYVLLAPTARWPCKCWPIDRFCEITQRLLDQRKDVSHVIVLVGPGEESMIQSLRGRFTHEPRVALPQTTVGQAMALISSAKVVVCNDSAALHIAVGFNRNIVAIFGPTNPTHVGPYRRPEAVIQPEGITAEQMNDYRRHNHDQSLISRVAVETVWQKLIWYLDQK